MFEKRKEQEIQKEESLPKLQTTLSIFPDFEEKYALKNDKEVFHSNEESASDILLRIAIDFEKLAQKLK